MTFAIDKEIIRKLDIPGPRYTSYPTAPNWESNFSSARYTEKLKELGQSDKTISLYFHLPFCQ
ncbi:Coproporphyrinogen III oxidase, oxygen-independent, partial [hydrothermal vent metagenome]